MTRRLVTPLSNYVDLGNGDFEMKDENIYGVLEDRKSTRLNSSH